MTLKTVLSELKPVRGMSSVIAVLFAGGDPASVSGDPATLQTSRETAEAELAKYRHAMDTCTSDAAYWGYLGSVEYWQMVVNVLKASELVGPDNLPDVPLPPRDGLVMDLCAKQAKFGSDVLRLSQARREASDAERAVAPAASAAP